MSDITNDKQEIELLKEVIRTLRGTIEANHVHHEEWDMDDGYQGSELCERNTFAIELAAKVAGE